MFKITYEEYGELQKPIYCNDINTMSDILIGLVNEERVERETLDWCCKAKFGENFINQKYRFEIACIYDEKNIIPPKDKVNIIDIDDKNVVQLIVDRLSKETGLEYVKDGNTKWFFKIPEQDVTDNKQGIILFLVDTNCKVLELRVYASEKGNTNNKLIYNEKSVTKNKLTKENLDKYITKCANILNNYKRIVSKNINSTELIQKALKLERTGCIRNNELAELLRDAKALNMEIRIRIYRQECWEVYIERHPYGDIRYWVKRSPKIGQEEIKQVYINSDGKGYKCDLKIRESVVDKILTSYGTLKEMGLIK